MTHSKCPGRQDDHIRNRTNINKMTEHKEQTKNKQRTNRLHPQLSQLLRLLVFLKPHGATKRLLEKYTSKLELIDEMEGVWYKSGGRTDVAWLILNLDLPSMRTRRPSRFCSPVSSLMLSSARNEERNHADTEEKQSHSTCNAHAHAHAEQLAHSIDHISHAAPCQPELICFV